MRAGSATYPLDVIAGLTADGKTLRIAVVNATFEAQRLTVDVRGIDSRTRGTVWRLTGKSLDARNKVGQPPGVTITQYLAPALSRGLNLPPLSTSIYEYPVARPR